MVWIDLAASQDNEGNSEVREAKLVKITAQVYTRSYPGGLMKYVDDIHDAYAGLDILGNEYTSKQKMQTLLNNLEGSGLNDHTVYLVNHCRNTFTTFEQCIKYLRREAIRRNHISQETGSRRAKLSVTDDNPTENAVQPDFESMVAFCDDWGMERTSENLRLANMVIQRNPDFHIPKKSYDLLKDFMSSETLKKFLEAKLKAEKAAYPDNPNESRPNENKPPVVPRQYKRETKANMVSQEEQSDSDDSEATTESQKKAYAQLAAISRLYEEECRNVCMIRLANNTTTAVNTTPYRKLIFDTGADTCIIGQGWKVTQYYGPLISIVGFDSVHARKKDLKICSAETIIEHPTAGKFLLRIHQAVHNPSSKDTLLSEYQLSQAGCRIDSKPKDHVFPNGEKGTLSLMIPGHEVVFNLQVDSCLITYPHRLPSPEESETMILVEITLLDTWDPSVHTKSAIAATARILQLKTEIMDSRLLNQSEIDIPSFDNLTLEQAEDHFIDSMEPNSLHQDEDQYNVVNYMVKAVQTQKIITPKLTKKQPIKPLDVQPCLAYLPIDRIQRTLNCTTQLVKWHLRVPMQRHWKPRFPFMNVHRLREPVATDTFFASCKALGGFTCAQVFLEYKVT